MPTTVTNTEFVQHVYDALNDQDCDAFTALCADDRQLHSRGFQSLDAVNQHGAVTSHCEIACQRRRRHVSR